MHSGIDDPEDAVVSDRGELCPETTSDRYVLYYDADTTEVFPQDEDTFPVGGQQLTVCVINSDWRDVYRVGTTDEIALDSGTKGPAFEVGPPEPQAFEATERVQETQAVSLQARCGGRNIANTVALIEQLRADLLERIRTAFETRLGGETVDDLRAALRELRSPNDARNFCNARPEDGMEEDENGEGAETAESSQPEEPAPRRRMRCSLEQYVNFYALPDWLWLVGSQIYLDTDALAQANCAPAAIDPATVAPGRVPTDPASALIPPEMRPLLVSLLRALAKASALIDFTESVLTELNAPQRIFDLGAFDDDRLVFLRISRHRRMIEYENGTLRSAWQARFSTRRQEVHSLSYFRVEPGFVFSALRRPSFSIGANDIGDRIVRLDDDGLRVFHPAVMLSFYWCGVDLRYSPFRRVCHAHQDSWVGDILPLLPTPAIGIPIDDTLISGTGSIFLGGVINWFPYVSLGFGAHLGLNVRTLRNEFRVGDPVPFAASDLDAVTEREVHASPYISITVAGDAFAALQGFEASN